MITSLPPSVRQVLQLAATGLSSREIADQLDMPVQDVHRCLAEAIDLLGAQSKLEAVIIAIRHGEVDPPQSAERARDARMSM
jgi:DNA-binding NarL/FixJ family response regulator